MNISSARYKFYVTSARNSPSSSSSVQADLQKNYHHNDFEISS